jgi:hypothetical protein
MKRNSLKYAQDRTLPRGLSHLASIRLLSRPSTSSGRLFQGCVILLRRDHRPYCRQHIDSGAILVPRCDPRCGRCFGLINLTIHCNCSSMDHPCSLELTRAVLRSESWHFIWDWNTHLLRSLTEPRLVHRKMRPCQQTQLRRYSNALGKNSMIIRVLSGLRRIHT